MNFTIHMHLKISTLLQYIRPKYINKKAKLDWPSDTAATIKCFCPLGIHKTVFKKRILLASDFPFFRIASIRISFLFSSESSPKNQLHLYKSSDLMFFLGFDVVMMKAGFLTFDLCRVSVHGVKSLGGHFACFARGLNFVK